MFIVIDDHTSTKLNHHASASAVDGSSSASHPRNLKLNPRLPIPLRIPQPTHRPRTPRKFLETRPERSLRQPPLPMPQRDFAQSLRDRPWISDRLRIPQFPLRFRRIFQSLQSLCRLSPRPLQYVPSTLRAPPPMASSGAFVFDHLLILPQSRVHQPTLLVRRRRVTF